MPRRMVKRPTLTRTMEPHLKKGNSVLSWTTIRYAILYVLEPHPRNGESVVWIGKSAPTLRYSITPQLGILTGLNSPETGGQILYQNNLDGVRGLHNAGEKSILQIPVICRSRVHGRTGLILT